MEALERLNLRNKRGGTPTSGNISGSGSMVFDSPQSRKRAELQIPAHYIIPAEKFAQGLIYDVNELGNSRPNTTDEGKKKTTIPSRPTTATTVNGAQDTKRQNAYDRFQAQAPPPMWTFSEKIDLNTMLLDYDAKITKWRYDHPKPFDNFRKTPKPPVFVKDQWYAQHRPETDQDDYDGDDFFAGLDLNRTGQSKHTSRAHSQAASSRHTQTSRPTSAPQTQTKITKPSTAIQRKVLNPLSLDIKPAIKKDYHEVYQPVREVGQLSPRHRLCSKTIGKAVNHDLPLYPALKERLDHGIHTTRWNVMSIPTDDLDRLFPIRNRPTVTHEDFEQAFHATRTIRGEFVETIRKIDEVPVGLS
jgi:hypothetical protein